ncbi:MAG: DUF3293 domain-containing protein [Gammaproteobacteria bacterium]|jgi:hypothetical protein|nr:DUF3293 domain-containing protein [Gammaproteobacteria bacterium]
MHRTHDHANLLKAFTSTCYRVALPTMAIDLHLAEEPPALLASQAWLIITVDNPQARRCSDQDNRRRREQLRQQLQQYRALMYPSLHVAVGTNWPNEHGWLVCTSGSDGLGEKLIQLGRQYQQRALVAYSAQTALERHAGKPRNVIELLWL